AVGGRLPVIVEQTAYRVMREGLTTVHKHAAGTETEVLLAYRPDRLDVEVRNGLCGRARWASCSRTRPRTTLRPRSARSRPGTRCSRPDHHQAAAQRVRRPWRLPRRGGAQTPGRPDRARTPGDPGRRAGPVQRGDRT